MTVRPIYESEADKEREFNTLAIVANEWNATFKQTPPLSAFDAYFYRNKKLKAIVEVKNRNLLSFDPNPYYEISHKKLIKCKEASKELGVPAFLVVNFLDSIEYVAINDATIDCLKEGGRYDRGDQYDIEEMACIHIDKFKTIYRKRVDE